VKAVWCVTLRVAATPGGLRVTVTDDGAEPIVTGFQLP
jgi:anti-sigma regulatory factor (Ser/Thr protein kinase)